MFSLENKKIFIIRDIVSVKFFFYNKVGMHFKRNQNRNLTDICNIFIIQIQFYELKIKYIIYSYYTQILPKVLDLGYLKVHSCIIYS